MESFRTLIPLKKAPFRLTHADRLMCTGSCFTEHIGDRLLANKFRVLVNPFGIVYNPVSMAQALDRLLDGDRPYLETDLVEFDGLWHSWDHHGQFSRPDRNEALSAINSAYSRSAALLRQCNRLMLTLGTATVYALEAGGRTVANCHKAPDGIFRKTRLGVDEICDALYPTLSRLRERLPGLEIILTVSPVRHLRDGAVENQRSKAALVLACAELEARMAHALYFPAYEILLDDLRDYRFYARDMLHPGPAAIDYIWEHFDGFFFDAPTRELNGRIENVRQAMAHRPFNPGTAAHRKFLQSQIAALRLLQEERPDLDFSAEIAFFSGGA